MSTLRERMDRLCEVFTAQVPAEIKAVMSGATEDLCALDIFKRLPIQIATKRTMLRRACRPVAPVGKERRTIR